MQLTWNHIILLVIILGMIFVIISENRHPVKTLAWCMILIFLPVAGILLYILFGMDSRNRRQIRQDELLLLKNMTARIQKDEIADCSSHEHAGLAGMLENANMAFPLIGNKVEIFTDFGSMYDSLLHDVESAVHHIHILFFKFEADRTGRRLADALIRKAGEGVDVRLIYDDAANLGVSKRFFRRMQKAGIQVESFIRIHLPILSRDYNSRNHRKIVVIDAKCGYMGGMNIADRYDKGLKWGIWRDTHMKITGPAVSEMQTSFLTDWKFTSGQVPDTSGLYAYNPPCGDTLMQIVTGGPMDRWNIVMQGFMTAIAQARRYVYMQSPYFIPPEPMLRVLQNSALGGVDVRIMIPYRGDKGILPPLASFSYVKEALESGIRIYLYQKGYMHAKTIVCDDSFLSIGSTNIDFRGYEQDFELNAFIYDRELATRQKDIFLADMQECRQVTLEEWQKRPLARRAMESFARMFSPLL